MKVRNEKVLSPVLVQPRRLPTMRGRTTNSYHSGGELTRSRCTTSTETTTSIIEEPLEAPDQHSCPERPRSLVPKAALGSAAMPWLSLLL
jgi:hypothetical protein